MSGFQSSNVLTSFGTANNSQAQAFDSPLLYHTIEKFDHQCSPNTDVIVIGSAANLGRMY